MLIEQIQLENGCALGLLFEMQKYPLLVIKAEKGFLMCGYLNVNAAETLGDTAIRTRHIINYAHLLLYVLIFTIKVANRNSNN